MDIRTKITLKFIMNSAKTDIDLKWKMNKFIENGDVSFLGHGIKDLNEQIKKAEDELEQHQKTSEN